MKKSVKILLALGAILVVFLTVVAMQPAEFHVARSITVAAPPAAVFAQVNDLHQWSAWSPWAKQDPAMKESFEGAPAGVGTSYSWAGNNEVGEGRMTITESRTDELVRLKLEFLKPFPAVNTAEFAFKSEGNQTAVTWSMSGRKNFICKGVCLFVSMDKMVGGQFEQGLAEMKKRAEAAPQPNPKET